MQKQPALIGLEAVTGRAIRFQGEFVILDLIFRLAARASIIASATLASALRPSRSGRQLDCVHNRCNQ